MIHVVLNAADFWLDLRTRLNTFTKTQKKIAKHIIDTPEDLAFLAAGKLALKIGVSESAVVKFAKELGLSGYSELQICAQERLRTEFSMLDMIIAEECCGDNSLLDNINQDIINVKTLSKNVTQEMVEQAAHLLYTAYNIWVVGVREASSLALLLGIFLDYIRPRVLSLISGDVSLLTALRWASPADALVVFSFARYTKASIDAAYLAKSKGTKVIVITDSLASPAAQIGDVVFSVPSQSASFFNSYSGAVTIINVLISEIAKIMPEKTKYEMERLEKDVLDSVRYWRRGNHGPDSLDVD